MQLVWLALGTFVSEDLACIGAGVLVAQGKLHWLPATLACLAGIYIGDLLLYLGGLLASQAVLRRVEAGKLERAKLWLARHQMRAVFLSRFTPGMRLPTYVAAGILRMPVRRFAAALLVAAAAWTPLLVVGTAWAGERLVSGVVHQARGVVTLVAALWAVLWVARRLTAVRKLRWEFWPVWAAYLPLLPYFVWLAVKHRSLTLFTAANPGIPGGGLAGESKSAILEQLDGRRVAPFALIPASAHAFARRQMAREFLSRRGLTFPVVLKPDVGERGNGVAIVRSEREMEAYLRAACGDTLIQQYVAGVEFGVFYSRVPGEERGRVWSITEKVFPSVCGDGVSTMEQLIRRDRRAVCLLETYLARARRKPDEVIAEGERVALVDVGSHCKGAVFLDGRRFWSAELDEAVERVSRSFAGFAFGRYDVRAESAEAFGRGEFTVIELNGVSAEPTHIYDPAVSVWDAYRAMAHQWKSAWEIGAAQARRGFAPTPILDLLRLVRQQAVGSAMPRAIVSGSPTRLVGQ